MAAPTSRSESRLRTDRLAASNRSPEDNVSALQVELVAADRRVWVGEAKMVRCRTASGEMGIMPGHTPLLGVLVSGDLTISESDGGRQVAGIDNGFLSVEHDRVTIVADHVSVTSARD